MFAPLPHGSIAPPIAATNGHRRKDTRTRTTKVRGRVQSIDWHSVWLVGTYCAHDRRGQQQPDDGGSAHSTGGDNASGAINDFHVASNWSPVGMGRGKGNPVRAV